MLELLVALVVVLFAVGIVANTTVAVSRLTPLTRERALAMDAARELAEQLGDEEFDRLFATYNATAADDPDGPGTAPGSAFAVPGLTPARDDPDGFVGRIEMCEVDGALREDQDDATLGTPRDLDFDGVIDATDHAGDYLVLPVRIVVEWVSSAGPCRYELTLALTAP